MCSGIFTTQIFIVASVIGAISVGVRQSGLMRPSYPIVNTENGQIRGFMSVSREGRSFASFVGIPFASPPIQNLRFEAPVKPQSWKGVREANRFAPDCYQYDSMVYAKYMGAEDCLYLNVYSPAKPGDDVELPVMVWIHGGGFLSGGARLYDPRYFMDEDVIVVTINYRLGPLGFLNSGSEIRGNMGLKDQVLALTWVKNNIKNFGGSEKVTIFGESAGAASVHYHIISEASKGLFHKAILQSGTAISPWALTPNPIHQALEFGKVLKCPTENEKELAKCLKNVPVKDLYTPMIHYMNRVPLTYQEEMFVPSVESVLKDDTFLSENPRILIEEGRFTSVPAMMGVLSGEGALRTSRLEINHRGLKLLDEKWNEYVPLVQLYDPSRTDVSQKIREQYFAPGRFSDNIDGFLKNFTIMMSDGWFFHSLHNAALQHSKNAPVHLYYYDYKSNLPSVYSLLKAAKPDDWLLAELKAAVSVAKDMFKKYFGLPGPHEYGPCHADDLFQEWRLDWVFEIGTGSHDYKFSKAFVKALVDFASNDENLEFNGINWPQIDQNHPEQFMYMKLDAQPSVIPEPFSSRLSFWDSLNIRNLRDYSIYH